MRKILAKDQHLKSKRSSSTIRKMTFFLRPMLITSAKDDR
ncbi:hypothetical protein HMPREF3226_01244 [Prevotella corporis]|uniref:Uncharacterized protein n=1 Tax=Prevotella corporis TaxID=28128 RepID=A0A133Q988_9BACT|nr:hypothetical protein HMPREF3226_01244 [Prevotella corporis]